MKTHVLKKAAIITGLLFSTQLYAQGQMGGQSTLKPFSPVDAYRTWSFGLTGGVLSPQLFFGRNDFTGPKDNIGYGAFIKNQVLHGLGFRGDFFRGKLEGTHSLNNVYSSFNTQVHYAASLNADVNIASINWLKGRDPIMPYITGGAGMMNYQTVLHLTAGGTENYKKPKGNITEFYFPVTAGIKFPVTDNINLNLNYAMNFLNEDNLDGYSDGIRYDKFSYSSIGLEFALGDKSKPQLVTTNPVKMMYDDYVSQNQSLKADLAAQKAATDAALAAQKATMQSQFADLQHQLNAAIMDSDNDGVLDRLDKCPGTPAGVKVDGSGCPLPEAKTVTNIITEEDRKVVRDAIANLEFDFGKSTIRPKSFPSLERVARLLIDKNFSLKLAGHTDNVGSDAANLKLSKDRAESIKAYLVDKGANASRVEATGYGESQPIASNKTDAGRQKNRRVEFTLY